MFFVGRWHRSQNVTANQDLHDSPLVKRSCHVSASGDVRTQLEARERSPLTASCRAELHSMHILGLYVASLREREYDLVYHLRKHPTYT